MKKIAIFLLCCLIPFGVAATGCNHTEDDPETVNIMIQNLGYGYKWLETIGDKYEAETGIKVEVNPTVIDNRIASSLVSPKNNPTDLYFGVGSNFYQYIAQGPDVVSGYDCVLVDLEDVYERVPEGYGDEGKSIEDLVTPYASRISTYDKDGKKYFVTWAQALHGIVYNVKLFEQNPDIPLPRTTDELLKVCELIKGKNLKTLSGNQIYGFQYAVDYFKPTLGVWYAQYEGYETYLNFTEGKDNNGYYSAEIYNTAGRYNSLKVLQDLLDYDKEFANRNCTSYDFQQTQLKFLEGESFMIPNGDWLEREMSTNFEPGEVGIAFMKTPVNSAIIEHTPTIEDDTDLREVISYIDGGKTGDLSKEYSDTDIARIEEARNMVATQAQLHTAFIPAYSNNIDGAKDFLAYLFNEENQLLMMENAAGNTFALNYDFTKSETYEEMTSFTKSKFDILSNPDTIYIGEDYSKPMFYLGGLNYFSNSDERNYAYPKTSASYRTALQVQQEQYTEFAGKWRQVMSQAGVYN